VVSCVVGEGVAGSAVRPAALVLQGLGRSQWKSVQKGSMPAARSWSRKALVVIEAAGIRSASPFREDARPGDGEAVHRDAEPLHEGDVLGIAVVFVVGDVAGLAVEGLAGRVRERVPDGGSAAIGVDRAFHLVGAVAVPSEIPAGKRRAERP